MGIDICLNGYDSYAKRTARERAAFKRAVKKRDQLARESEEYKRMQEEVEKAADKMWAGCKGYIHSSYNGDGLFRVLEEIFGFDVAAYLFPGDWSTDQPIIGEEFVGKVKVLQETALRTLKAGKRELPWIDEFAAVSGERPGANEHHVRGELFGDSVFAILKEIVLDADRVEGGPREERRFFSEDHVWYITHGLKELMEFGALAERLNRTGEDAFAHISY